MCVTFRVSSNTPASVLLALLLPCWHAYASLCPLSMRTTGNNINHTHTHTGLTAILGTQAALLASRTNWLNFHLPCYITTQRNLAMKPVFYTYITIWWGGGGGEHTFFSTKRLGDIMQRRKLSWVLLELTTVFRYKAVEDAHDRQCFPLGPKRTVPSITEKNELILGSLGASAEPTGTFLLPTCCSCHSCLRGQDRSEQIKIRCY